MFLQFVLHNLPTILSWLSSGLVELYLQILNYAAGLSVFKVCAYLVSLCGVFVSMAMMHQKRIRDVITDDVGQVSAREEQRLKKLAELTAIAETQIAELQAQVEAGTLDPEGVPKSPESLLPPEILEPIKPSNVMYRRRWFMEFSYSWISIVLAPLTFPIAIIVHVVRWLIKLFRGNADSGTNYLVFSMGPGYVRSAQIITVIYLVALVLDPLLARQNNLSLGYSFWEFTLLGGNTALSSLLPLINYPALALSLHFVLWTSLWWTLAQVLRLINASAIYQNNYDYVEDVTETSHLQEPSIINFKSGWMLSWREASGHRDGWRAAYSTRWQKALVPVGFVCLAVGFTALEGDPYRLPPGAWVIGLVAWMTTVLNLMLEGAFDYKKELKPAEALVQQNLPGWPDVLSVMQEKPERVKHSNPQMYYVPPNPFATGTKLSSLPYINPLLADIRLSDAPETVLNEYQVELLERFHSSLQRYTTVAISGESQEELNLNKTLVYENNSDKREWLTVLPDGFGKTQTIFLLAAHFYLSTSQRSIILTRNNQQADALFKRFNNILAGDTLRWSIPLAKADNDFYGSIQDQFFPAITIISIEELALHFLPKLTSRSDVPLSKYLSSIGLVLFEDLESHLGTIEQHTYFTFRRLLLQVYRSRNFPLATDVWRPFILGFASDSMFNQRVWASSLIGLDFEIFHPKVETTYFSDLDDVSFVNEEEEEVEKDDKEIKSGHVVQYFKSTQFPGYSFHDIIEICEAQKVPWTYRVCGDGKRDIGLEALNLPNEPMFFKKDVYSAAVVLLTGHYTEIQRETKKILRLGTRFCQFLDKNKDAEPSRGVTPIAVISRIDSFESTVFESKDLEPSLQEAMVNFPFPLVRKSGPWVLRAHMAADIVRFWVEVEDLVKVFGIEAGLIVQRLQRNNLLMLESRRMINNAVSAYTNHVIVRAKRTALPSSKADSITSKLPYPVNSVETASHFPVDIFDQTSSRVLQQVDANSAALSFYLGKIWTTYFGRYIVKEFLFIDEVLPTGQKHRELRKILVEPTLSNEISTPRRQFYFENWPDAVNELEFRLYGERGIGVALQEFENDKDVLSESADRVGTQCKVMHQPTATLYLQSDNFDIKERRLLTLNEKQNLEHIQKLHTDALWIFPSFSPKEGVDPAELTLGGARVLIAIFRMLLPNIYRGGSEIELSVALKDTEISLGELDYKMGTEDALVLFDLQQEGSGAIRCVHREGLLLMIEFARAFLRPCNELQVFMRRYDHCPDDSELYKGQQQLNWNAARENLLEWFEQVLPNKSAQKAPPPPPPAPKDVPKESLPLLLDVPGGEPKTPWAEVADQLVAKITNEAALLQIRLHSLDRTIERFSPESEHLDVRRTAYGVEVELNKTTTDLKGRLSTLLDSLNTGQWSSKIEGWFHLYQHHLTMSEASWDKPNIGENGRYAVMNPKDIHGLIRTILPNVESIALSPIAQRFAAMCEIFDWMHQNIRYELDDVLYSTKEYIATPAETLKHQMGDCEDHANLIAAFALELGIVPRIALITGHALCELYIGKVDEVDRSQVETVIREYLERKTVEFGLEFGQWPYAQGKFSNGWKRDGLTVVRDGSNKYGFYSFEFNGIQTIETDGEVWVLLDDCFGGLFIGDASSHIEKGYILPSTTAWVEEHFQEYHYPSEQWINEQEARLFRRVDISMDTPPEPPTHVLLRGQVLTDGLGAMEELSIPELAGDDVSVPTPHATLPPVVEAALQEYRRMLTSAEPTAEPTPESEAEETSLTPDEPEISDEADTIETDSTNAEENAVSGEETGADSDVGEPDAESTDTAEVDGDGDEAIEGDEETAEDDVTPDTVPVEMDTPTEEGDEAVLTSDDSTTADLSSMQLTMTVVETKALASEPPTVSGEYGLSVNFQFRGQVYPFNWGFKTSEELEAYRGLICLDGLSLETSYELELFPTAIHGLLDALRTMYGGKADAFFTEFILSFVQSLPSNSSATGLHKTPSQTLLFGGSDQELSALCAYLLNMAGQEFFVASDSTNRHGGVVSGPFSGYHVALDEGQKYFFVDVAHHKTAPGICTWSSVQEWLLQDMPTLTNRENQLKVVLHEITDSVAKIDIYGAFDGSRYWVVLQRSGMEEVLLAELQVEAMSQMSHVRIEIPAVETGGWTLYLTNDTAVLGVLMKENGDGGDSHAPTVVDTPTENEDTLDTSTGDEE